MTDMRQRVEQAGRSFDEIRVIAMSGQPWDLDSYRALDDLGVHDCITVPWTDPTTTDSKVDLINRFRDEVIVPYG